MDTRTLHQLLTFPPRGFGSTFTIIFSAFVAYATLLQWIIANRKYYELEGLRGVIGQSGICMKKIVAELFKRPITKEQSKDTGMAMVLLLLLFSGAFKRETLVTIAIVALVVDMTFPQLYRPVAVLWLGLSHLLGTVVSKILLTLVFFGVVTPIGVARKLLGFDSLKLRDFKSGENSVMVIRNHLFTGKDIEKPY